jgi:hypothetical protein
VLEINGTAITTPKIFSVAISDIDGESNRNAKGELIRDRIAVKRKLECEWPPLKMSEISTLLQAVSTVYFTITYPDPVEGTQVTKTFYVGDRTAPVYWLDPVTGEYLWQGLKMNFIEC